MHRKLRLMLPIAVCLLTVLIAAPATAALAATADWQKVDVTLHAEQTGSMMLISGDLPASVALPAEAELAVPAGSAIQWIGQILGGDPSADPTLMYTKSTVNELDIYRFTLTESRTAQIEIPTTDSLGFDGVNYTAFLKWSPSQAISEVRMIVRLPQGAQVVQPIPGATLSPGEEGYSYYTKTISNVKAGDALDLTFSYSAPAATGIGGTQTTAKSSSGTIILVVMLVGIAMIATILTIAIRGQLPGNTPTVDVVPVPARTRTKSAHSKAVVPVKAPPVQTPVKSGSGKRNALTVGVIGVLIGAAIIVATQTSKPTIAGDTVTQTFSQGQPCSNVSIPVNLAGADPLAAAETLFDALRTLDGMNSATLNIKTSTLQVGYCESSSNDDLVRQGLLPTGLVADGAPAPSAQSAAPSGTSGAQALTVDTSSGSFSPTQLTAKSGTPIEITFGQGAGCVAEVVFPDLQINQSLENGPVTITLPALAPGNYAFACGMDMQHGTLVVQ